MAPPQELSDAECAVWEQVLEGTPAGWWQVRHRPMLAMYCAHVVTWQRCQEKIRQAEQDLAHPSAEQVNLDWLSGLCSLREREARAALSLATKMRLTHQATRHRDGDETPPGGQSRRPWDDGEPPDPRPGNDE
jgi:hypothetical protein